MDERVEELEDAERYWGDRILAMDAGRPQRERVGPGTFAPLFVLWLVVVAAWWFFAAMFDVPTDCGSSWLDFGGQRPMERACIEEARRGLTIKALVAAPLPLIGKALWRAGR